MLVLRSAQYWTFYSSASVTVLTATSLLSAFKALFLVTLSVLMEEEECCCLWGWLQTRLILKYTWLHWSEIYCLLNYDTSEVDTTFIVCCIHYEHFNNRRLCYLTWLHYCYSINKMCSFINGNIGSYPLCYCRMFCLSYKGQCTV
jgi:hypothetical protein